MRHGRGKLLATNFNNSMHSINAHKQQQSPPFVAQALDSFAQILSLARTHINHSSAENKNKFIVPQIKWEKRQKKEKDSKDEMEKSTSDFSNSDKAIRIQSESKRKRVKYTYYICRHTLLCLVNRLISKMIMGPKSLQSRKRRTEHPGGARKSGTWAAFQHSQTIWRLKVRCRVIA